MGKVGVHLHDERCAAIQGVAEPGQIGRAQPHLARPVQHVHPAGMLLGQVVGHPARPVGRVVVHEQDFEVWNAEGQQLACQGGQVFGLVVGGNDHHQLRLIHDIVPQGLLQM